MKVTGDSLFRITTILKGTEVINQARDTNCQATETKVSKIWRNYEVGQEINIFHVLNDVLRPILHERNTVLGFKRDEELLDTTNDI